MDAKEIRRRRRERNIPDYARACRHAPMGMDDVCRAGVRIKDLTGDAPGCGLRRPCRPAATERLRKTRTAEDLERFGDVVACEKFEAVGEEAAREAEADIEYRISCLARKVSSCCGASLDESQVIRSGRHKGHGPRFCSKCGRVAYMV